MIDIGAREPVDELVGMETSDSDYDEVPSWLLRHPLHISGNTCASDSDYDDMRGEAYDPQPPPIPSPVKHDEVPSSLLRHPLHISVNTCASDSDYDDMSGETDDPRALLDAGEYFCE